MNAKLKDWEIAAAVETMSDNELDKALERKLWYREQQKDFDLGLPESDEPGTEEGT